ncbi:MAG TPA: hypothetical protein VM717_10830 [Chthoniobacterales bacterium]|nr:hypothetical protein [Chthoniobacterales bacterium]
MHGHNDGNQYGDYEGLVWLTGCSHLIWTDSWRELDLISVCSTNPGMEEVFIAKVK